MKKLLATVFSLAATVTAYAGNNGLQISDLEVGVESTGIQAVTGVATNTSNATIKSAFIRFNLYDAQNNIIGNTIADGNDIAPGDHWKFKAQAAQKFDHAKLISVDTY